MSSSLSLFLYFFISFYSGNLIDYLDVNKINSHDHEQLSLNEIADLLLSIIKLTKDAKSLVSTWKILSKYLIKNRLKFLTNLNLNVYLRECYESINLNLNFIKLNSIISDETFVSVF